jgi:NADH-quinone oxidoreductase subunit F
VLPQLARADGNGAPFPLRLLARIGRADPTSLDDYRAHGGYAALRLALERGPAWVLREVTDSGLVGRGGAAFPTGRKWQAVAQQPARPRYLVCNADESEPGTFKDRVLMEADPFAVVEAMTIAGITVGAERGFLYVRGEYPLAEARIAGALAAARARGYLGDDVLGKGARFEIEVRRGAGAYICGEETALFASIEGFRGEPRTKPPFPVECGLFGRPTVVNNVETLVNVLPILVEGAARYRALGTPGSPGTRLFCVAGHVAHPGLYELPFGVKLSELLALAGAGEVQTVLLGGAAGTFLAPGELELPLTFEDAKKAGATLGSGVVLVLDRSVALAPLLARIARFFRDESCGQCVPCRVGTVRQEELVARLQRGRCLGSHADELGLLKELGQVMRDASICGLGQTASSAIESAVAKLGALAPSNGAPPR